MCRTQERHYDLRGKQQAWRTSSPEGGPDDLAGGFASLLSLDEHRLCPSAVLPRQARREAEVVTYVREGALAFEDSLGCSGVVHAGEFQRMSVGLRMRHSETNASRSDWAHVIQVWLRPAAAELEPSNEQKRFSTADRRGALRVVASPDARRGSLRLHEDVLVLSGLLEPGAHVVHELRHGRSAWLHLVLGEVTFGGGVLVTGDGVGVSAERAVSFTARRETEVLLVDLGAGTASCF